MSELTSKTNEHPHHKAMDLAEKAMLARLHGRDEEAVEHSRQALAFELEAIAEVPLTGTSAPIQPTYSVLCRSAGWLAFNANEFETAEKLAKKGLVENTPLEIEKELHELWDAAKEKSPLRRIIEGG